MFNKKKIQELEDRIWQLENPPKYKIGDKHNGGIIFEVKFRPKTTFTLFYEHIVVSPNHYEYKALIKGKIINFVI